MEKLLGKKNAMTAVSQLISRNMIIRSYETEPVRVKPRIEPFLSLNVDSDAVQEAVSDLFAAREP